MYPKSFGPTYISQRLVDVSPTQTFLEQPGDTVDGVGKSAIGDLAATRVVGCERPRRFCVQRPRSCVGHSVDYVGQKLFLRCRDTGASVPLEN